VTVGGERFGGSTSDAGGPTTDECGVCVDGDLPAAVVTYVAQREGKS
jgi:hypothetical protein